MQDRFARRGRQRHLVAPDARVLSRAALDALKSLRDRLESMDVGAWPARCEPRCVLPASAPASTIVGASPTYLAISSRSIPMTSLPRSLRSNRSGRLMAILTLRKTRLCHSGQQCTRASKAAFRRAARRSCGCGRSRERSSMALPYAVSPSFESSVVRPRAHCESIESSPRVDQQLLADLGDTERPPSSAARSTGPAARSPRTSDNRTEARIPPSARICVNGPHSSQRYS